LVQKKELNFIPFQEDRSLVGEMGDPPCFGWTESRRIRPPSFMVFDPRSIPSRMTTERILQIIQERESPSTGSLLEPMPRDESLLVNEQLNKEREIPLTNSYLVTANPRKERREQLRAWRSSRK
jgi:hypothetical protein